MPKLLRPTLRLILLTVAFLIGAAAAAAQTRVQPVLGFPEQGLDDPPRAIPSAEPLA